MLHAAIAAWLQCWDRYQYEAGPGHQLLVQSFKGEPQVKILLEFPEVQNPNKVKSIVSMLEN